MKNLFFVVLALLLFVPNVAGASEGTSPTDTSSELDTLTEQGDDGTDTAANTKDRIAWYESLKYGMFIHYNMPTFHGAASMGANCKSAEPDPDPKKWNPTGLDTDQWMEVVKAAGMSHAILTVKHHHGFCLWDSAHTDFDVASSGNTTDVVEAFVKSARAAGITYGFYVNLGRDIHHWGCNHQVRTNSQFEEFQENIVEELLTKYPDCDMLWFDGPAVYPNNQNMYDHIKSINSDVIVINNFGDKPGNVGWPYDVGHYEFNFSSHNYEQNESHGGKDYYVPKGICHSIYNSWFWRPGLKLKTQSSLKELHKLMMDKGGVDLVNLGPNQAGVIPHSGQSNQRQHMIDLYNDLFGVAPPIDDRDESITYEGSWSETGDSSDYNSTCKVSSTENDYAEYTFTGEAIKLAVRKGPSCGKANIYIDGQLDETIDTYKASTQGAAYVYENHSLSNATHTIKVEVSHEKNTSSTGHDVNIDFFEYGSIGGVTSASSSVPTRME
ncbi:Alpha-L-fucosidase [Novipirellula aureliae]|uniref:alpha-L-fucosidase n=1 Tax=Novipirellula aureliae TaxID=2527966 RepID=A0A5C6E8E5_9BACT|nr:alpha-L-fucosidase [Novipirellula aureliae]TWU44247.1 Alpha-L-fucosidase [Novipirellula aureliae]